ncbi:type II toxin-antitoxin system VapC family toxin [Parapedobacter sp. DT-150]|uniref:type II toxin-antitoxin system VapC family toxin n=1 Tax=Parapedobacter sp. DT-150 TaxID=3396162 RepID=UPI003F1BC623
MKVVFVDTNILIDLLADRPPFSKYAVEIFDLAEKKEVKLFTSSHSFATSHYLLKKFIDEEKLREILHDLLNYLTIVPIDYHIIKRSLLSDHKDFEDAIQIMAATSVVDLDYIVTRNIKDFKKAPVPVLPPDELVQNLNRS